MSEDNKIVSPGINAETVWRIQNSPRALIANKFYSLATGIKNRAGAFVGFALTDSQLDELCASKDVRGRDTAKSFFKKYSQDSGAVEVGKFILVGVETDMFLDLLAGLPVQAVYKKPCEIVTPFSATQAKEINQKRAGERW